MLGYIVLLSGVYNLFYTIYVSAKKPIDKLLFKFIPTVLGIALILVGLSMIGVISISV